MNIKNLLCESNDILKRNLIPSYILDSELILCKVLNKDRKYLILNDDLNLQNDEIIEFKNLVSRRAKKEPIAYILGEKSFWKDDFLVKKGTLIPRPETELIVEEVINISKNNHNLKILEVGTGTGCLILSIMRERPNLRATAIDISKACIELAKANAKKLGLIKKIKFYKSDIDNLKNHKYDIIVSNPPYINKFDLNNLDDGILKFEPKLALYGGVDGGDCIKKIIYKSSKILKRKGKLILEIAHDQRNYVLKILRKENFYINKIVKDFSNISRSIISTKI